MWQSSEWREVSLFAIGLWVADRNGADGLIHHLLTAPMSGPAENVTGDETPQIDLVDRLEFLFDILLEEVPLSSQALNDIASNSFELSNRCARGSQMLNLSRCSLR